MSVVDRAPTFCLLLLLPVSLLSSQHSDFKIALDVNLVVLGVTVTDRNGEFVTGLGQESFRVYENERLQETKLFRAEDVPVTVGLVVDSSGSMRPKRAETVEAALAFMQYSNPEDEMFVIRFNEKVSFALPEPDAFTSEPQELRTALMAGQATGRTALYDAMAAGLEQLERGACDKKILIVFSDGGDNASRLGLRETLRLAEQSHAIIYTIGLFHDRDPDRNPGVLKRFARATGGEAYLSNPSRDIAGICKRIARDIRNQYTIGYVPDNKEASYRRIRVIVDSPKHGKLTARTRAGYMPPENRQ